MPAGGLSQGRGGRPKPAQTCAPKWRDPLQLLSAVSLECLIRDLNLIVDTIILVAGDDMSKSQTPDGERAHMVPDVEQRKMA